MPDDDVKPAQPAGSELLTVPEVAGMFRVSRMTIYRLVRDGKMPHLRIGDSIRIRRAEIEGRATPQTGRPQS